MKDKTKYRVTLPTQQIEGVLFGKRILLTVGEYTIEDLTNKIYARVKIYPEKRGFFKSIFVKQKDRKDHLKGYITRDPKEFEKFLDHYIYGVSCFEEYLERCGGLKKLKALQKLESLVEK